VTYPCESNRAHSTEFELQSIVGRTVADRFASTSIVSAGDESDLQADFDVVGVGWDLDDEDGDDGDGEGRECDLDDEVPRSVPCKTVALPFVVLAEVAKVAVFDLMASLDKLSSEMLFISPYSLASR
jgi:hypothetical protein